MKYLEVKNIKKKFTNKNVLNNIDYKFSTGTIYALLGENGAGKTTLVSILSGIKKATDGQILVNEKTFDKGFISVKQANQNKIRITHQHPTINDELTVYEYCLIANNRKRIKEKCEADFVYPSEGCGKTRTEINAPMPHTRYICETSERMMRPYTIEYTKNECRSSILLF